MESLKISKDHYRKLRDYVEINCGISLGYEKDFLVESRLSDLFIQSGFTTLEEFFQKVQNSARDSLCDKIVTAMTETDSHWFREKYVFPLLEKKIFPSFQTSDTRKIRIWSMSCSTGQDPYSIAISIQEYCKRFKNLSPEMFEIMATDICPSSLYKAINGNYDIYDMRKGLVMAIKSKYFKKNRAIYHINQEIKDMVTFMNFHLENNFSSLGNFDIIFCRYATKNYSNSFKNQLFKKISEILNQNGILFLGTSESINENNNDFEMISHRSGQYYRVKS